MPTIDQRKLGQILIDLKYITVTQLEEALAEQRATGRFFGEILTSRGLASEEQIARALSDQLGLAFVDVKKMEIETKALELIPRDLCLKYNLVPILVSQNTLTVAMANALDVQAVDRIQELTGLRIRPVFGCLSAIRSVLEPPGVKAESLAPAEPLPAAVSAGRTDQVSSLKKAANLAPVIERVNHLIEKAVEMGASDIHLEPERDRFNLRYRIDGILHAMPPIPVEEQAAILSRIKIMADIDIAEKRLPQDGRVRIMAAGREVDLRVSTFPSIHGENMVIRILDRSGGLIRLKDLGLSEEHFYEIIRLIHRPFGMMLVTGPTGSGKTTTLYAALNEINSVQKNIITLEDPVEYELPNVRQCQINAKAGLTFSTGLRSIVRQDPDIILIGEIRDKETADIAIHAALTGHLVFSTLHTNDAPSAAARLIDMGVEPFLVASSVIGILAQRLVRTLCPHCKESYKPSEELLGELGLNKEPRTGEQGAAVFYKEAGCLRCKQYGYSGRTGIFELLLPNEPIKELITKKAPASLIAEAAERNGMPNLHDAGVDKVLQGITSVAEVMRVTEEI